MFTTERLVLRAFRSTDYPVVVGLLNNRQTLPLFSGSLPIPKTPSLEKMHLLADGSDMLCIIELREAPQAGPIGFAYFEKKGEARDQETTFVIALHPAYVNKGYGTEATRFMVNYAFLSLNIHRISLGVFEENERAAAVYKKIGFVEEARLRKARWVEGAWRDTIYMSVLREEWADKDYKPGVIATN